MMIWGPGGGDRLKGGPGYISASVEKCSGQTVDLRTGHGSWTLIWINSGSF